MLIMNLILLLSWFVTFALWFVIIIAFNKFNHILTTPKSKIIVVLLSIFIMFSWCSSIILSFN